MKPLANMNSRERACCVADSIASACKSADRLDDDIAHVSNGARQRVARRSVGVPARFRCGTSGA
jgi:hypothetical protein